MLAQVIDFAAYRNKTVGPVTELEDTDKLTALISAHKTAVYLRDAAVWAIAENDTDENDKLREHAYDQEAVAIEALLAHRSRSDREPGTSAGSAGAPA